jgi:protein gp37
MTTATETMKDELSKIQSAQADCVTEYGHVKTSCRHRYQILTKKAAALREAIDWMSKTVLVMLLICTTAHASDIDRAEEKLRETLSGEATISRVDVPKFNDADRAAIELAQRQLAELLGGE